MSGDNDVSGGSVNYGDGGGTENPRRTARLGWVTREGTLTELLPGLAGGVALLSSPRSFVVATIEPGGACADADGPVGLADIFEARAFTADRELRWRRDGATGQAVVLGETVTGTDTERVGGHGGEYDEVDGLEPVDVGYLLWGEPAPDSDQRTGWRTLSSARIGTIRVPGAWSDPPPLRLSLHAREYLAVDETYGNAYVFEERLVAIVDGEVHGD